MHKNYCLDSKITKRNFLASSEIKAFLLQNPEYNEKSLNEICMAAGGMDLFKRIMYHEHTRQHSDIKTEAIVNKHSNIYQSLFPIENQ